MKKMHMVGNSHIDTAWFWMQDEGLQQINSTLESAINRIEEYPTFKFTFAFSSFIEWIELVNEELLNKIIKYVNEGRIEFIGSLYIEADGCISNYELMLRQLLHGQKLMKRVFNRYDNLVFFADSFSTSKNISKIFGHSKIENFIVNRPSHLYRGDLFNLIADDGSSVRTLKLPGEYTTWFEKHHLDNIESAAKYMSKHNVLLTPYGVGNHGGGPTIENIKFILKLQREDKRFEYEISTLKTFLTDITDDNIYDMNNSLLYGGSWLYSCCEFKNKLFKTEKYLLEVEKICTLASINTNYDYPNEKFIEIEKIIMFNQFHDIISGTSTKSVMKEAEMQIDGAYSSLSRLRFEAISYLKDGIDTSKIKGTPLILFNFSDQVFKGVHEIEIDWFCKDELKVSFEGNELKYMLGHTEMTMIHKNIGGRRKIIFKHDMNPFTYSVISLEKEKPKLLEEKKNNELRVHKKQYVLEIINNEIIYTYNGEKGKIKLVNYTDFGNSWGCSDEEQWQDESPQIYSVNKIENGIVDSFRLKYKFYDSYEELILRCFDDYIDINIKINSVNKNKSYRLFIEKEYTEICTELMGGIEKFSEEDILNPMGRAIEFVSKNPIVVENEGSSCMKLLENGVQIMLLRTSLYALGECQNWYNPNKNYDYMGMGEYNETFRMHFSKQNIMKIDNTINEMLYSLVDYKHIAKYNLNFFNIENENIRISTLKRSFDNENNIIRFLNTSDSIEVFNFNGEKIEIDAKAIKTYKIFESGLIETNNLED